MSANSHLTFICYAREDQAFALKLAADLTAAQKGIWIDQLNIAPGERWDDAVEAALAAAAQFLIILSPDALASESVRDELSYALNEKKRIVPVLYRDCRLPLRLTRLQYIDVSQSYERGLDAIVRALPGAVADVEASHNSVIVRSDHSRDRSSPTPPGTAKRSTKQPYLGAASSRSAAQIEHLQRNSRKMGVVGAIGGLAGAAFFRATVTDIGTAESAMLFVVAAVIAGGVVAPLGGLCTGRRRSKVLAFVAALVPLVVLGSLWGYRGLAAALMFVAPLGAMAGALLGLIGSD